MLLRTKLLAAGCVALISGGAALVVIDPGEHGSSAAHVKPVGSVAPVAAADSTTATTATSTATAPPAHRRPATSAAHHADANVGTPTPAQPAASPAGSTSAPAAGAAAAPETNVATTTPQTSDPVTDAPSSSHSSSSSASSAPSVGSTSVAPPSVSRGDGHSMWIRIPAIHVNAPMVTVGVTPQHEIAVPPLDKPYETAWYDGSARPGHVGTAVVVGHIDSAATGAAVFYYLDKLRPGNLVTITLPHAGSVRYRVDGLRQYHKTTLPYARVFGPVSYPGLRLITCGGAFDYQTGHYVDNIVVYASMVS